MRGREREKKIVSVRERERERESRIIVFTLHFERKLPSSSTAE